MILIRLTIATLMIACATQIGAQQSPTTAFTYQGSLEQASQPADGVFDFRVQLYDGPDAGTGSTVGSALVIEDIAVVGGLFTLTPDFGAGAFDGEARWMEIGVRDGGSTGGFTSLAPFTAIVPAPQAQFAVTAATAGSADQAANADTLDGFSSGDFALAAHLHADLTAGDGLTGNAYTGGNPQTFDVGVGDGIAVDANSVSARVDGTSIGFTAGGDLTMLPHAPNYGDVATVAKSGGDYTDPVAAMNDRTNWSSETVICLLRIMPGIYDLDVALELHPFVHVIGVGNQLGQTVALRRNDTGYGSGVIDASACGFNGCRVGNLTVATATTDSMATSRAIYSEGGRMDLWRIFVIAQSDYNPIYGIETDSDTTISHSSFFVGGDIGYAINAFGGNMLISDSEFQVQTSVFRATAIQTSNTSLTLERNVIDARGADRAIAVDFTGGRLRDRHSRMSVSGNDRSRAVVVSDCSASATTLVGTEIRSEAAPSRTEGIYVTNCPQFEASQIRIETIGANADALVLDSTGFTLSHSDIDSDDDIMSVAYDVGDTNSYPVRVTHSRLNAPDLLLVQLGPYDDTAVALSRLESGSMAGAVSCANNVDENLVDLGNTCP